MIMIADSNIFMSALVTPTGLVASILAERKYNILYLTF